MTNKIHNAINKAYDVIMSLLLKVMGVIIVVFLGLFVFGLIAIVFGWIG